MYVKFKDSKSTFYNKKFTLGKIYKTKKHIFDFQYITIDDLGNKVFTHEKDMFTYFDKMNSLSLFLLKIFDKKTYNNKIKNEKEVTHEIFFGENIKRVIKAFKK